MKVAPADLSKASLRSDRFAHSLSVPKKALELHCVKERIRNWSDKRTPKAFTKYRAGHFVVPKSQAENKDKPSTSAALPEVVDESVDRVEPYSDVLITVRVMSPLKYDPLRVRVPKMDRELVFLGHNYLHEFRDMIVCTCDTIGPFLDISKDPSKDVRAADRYADKTSSGLLYIGDTLYNDTRHEANGDYSKEILAWAKQHPEVGAMKKGCMEKTQFSELKNIRLGFPYVYQHFGACEHVFMFSDIRLVAPADNRIRSDYPYLQLINNFRVVVCDICANYEASHQVNGSAQHIFDPVKLCAKCLNAYHYVDGKKLGEFSAYQLK